MKEQLYFHKTKAFSLEINIGWNVVYFSETNKAYMTPADQENKRTPHFVRVHAMKIIPTQ